MVPILLIRINAIENHKHILPINCLNIKSRVNWVYYDESLNENTNNNRQTIHKKKTNFLNNGDNNAMSSEFFSSFLNPNACFFNLCAGWNILMVGILKKEIVLFSLIHYSNLLMFVFKKPVLESFFPKTFQRLISLIIILLFIKELIVRLVV